MTEAVLQALSVGGPMAIVLGFAVFTLWNANAKLRVQYEGDPDNPEKTPGKLATQAKEARQRYDALREFYEEKLRLEREEQKAIIKELNSTLRGAFEETD